MGASIHPTAQRSNRGVQLGPFHNEGMHACHPEPSSPCASAGLLKSRVVRRLTVDQAVDIPSLIPLRPCGTQRRKGYRRGILYDREVQRLPVALLEQVTEAVKLQKSRVPELDREMNSRFQPFARERTIA